MVATDRRCRGHRVGCEFRRVCRAVRHVDVSAWGARGSWGLGVSGGGCGLAPGGVLVGIGLGGWGPCWILRVFPRGRPREIHPGHADFACTPAYIIIYL